MISEWQLDMEHSDRWFLVDTLNVIDEIPMAAIEMVCEELGIDCYRFNSAWIKLCDAAHEIINEAESGMVGSDD